MRRPPADSSGTPPPRFLAVDFFCGAGGTTRGLIDAGGYVIAGIDKEEKCQRTYVDNNHNQALDRAPPEYLQYDVFPKTDDHPDGQQRELFARLDDLIGEHSAKAGTSVPMLFAICAPCQPFTKLPQTRLTAKRESGRKRDAGLLAEAVKAVERFQPEMVLSENVATIGKPAYGGVWDEFRAALEGAGYITGSEIVCTSRFGIPQYRRRSILMAVRKDCCAQGVTHGMAGEALDVPSSDPDAPVKSVREALEGLPPIKAGEWHDTIPNHGARILSEINIKRLRAAKPGQSNVYLENTPDGDLSLPCHRRVNAKQKVRCFTDVYTRMHPDRPSPTITTKCHSVTNGRFGHYDPEQIRAISLREAAILQSFPENYRFHPDKVLGVVACMIGNAVPPKLAEFFAGHLLACMEKPAA